MNPAETLLAVRDGLNDQLGPAGVDYGALGDVSRRLRSLSLDLEMRAARESGEAAEAWLCPLQSARALRAILDALIETNRAGWEPVAILAAMAEHLAVGLEDEAAIDVDPAPPAAPAAVAARAAAAIRDSAAAQRRRFEFYGDPADALVAEFMTAVADRLDPPAPPGPGTVSGTGPGTVSGAGNVVALPPRGRPVPAPSGPAPGSAA
ncbi:MAG: hypothetical protein OXC28_07310 [Defluviicoccus sp.]|nr:hypothetical protein [Defluviicoccus sp.]